MLKQKETQADQIMTLKLSTGEEIICAWIGYSGNDQITVKRPLALVLAEMPGSPQQTQVVFTPWMLALPEDEVVHIERQHVISQAVARKDAADQYVSATRP